MERRKKQLGQEKLQWVSYKGQEEGLRYCGSQSSPSCPMSKIFT